MPDLTKLAGLIWDVLRDYFFALCNAKIKPESASKLGLDKIRAFQISAVVLAAVIAAIIQTMLRAQSFHFDALIFLLIALVYFSGIGLVHSLILSYWKIIQNPDTVTHDALTVVIGFNVLAESLLAVVLFASQPYLNLHSSRAFDLACCGAVVIAMIISLIRSERQLGLARIAILIVLLGATSWPFLRYIVLMGI